MVTRIVTILVSFLAVTVASSIQAFAVTINDTTLIERWARGKANGGWHDWIGGEEFDTKRAEITYSGSDVTIKLFTNFSGLAGYGDGKKRGWDDDYLYHAADLALDLDEDGSFETGICLVDHSNPPEDPRDGGDIPGATKPNPGTFKYGHIYSVTGWYTPDDIHRTTSSVGQKYDRNDPKTTYSWMYQGTGIGSASVAWNKIGNDGYMVKIILAGINQDGQWNSFNLLWATATCGNDVIAGHAEVPEPATILLFGVGLVAMAGLAKNNIKRSSSKG